MDNKILSTNTVVIFDNIEFRASQDEATKLPVLEGLAIPYNKRSKLLYGAFFERFNTDAFKKNLDAKPDVRMYNNHNTDQILARTKNKTLTLTNTPQGVSFRSVLNDTTYANDLMKAVNRGDIDSMSFGFKYVTREWAMEDGYELLIVSEAEIREISPVSDPAYEDTELFSRSIENMYKDVKEHKRAIQQRIDDELNMLKVKMQLLELD